MRSFFVTSFQKIEADEKKVELEKIHLREP